MEYPKFKVCVRCFTFNHSKYITDAMNGFVMQQTDFPYVCCIVDDASKDGEQEVIRKYVADNFDLSEGSCHFERETDYAFITYAQHKTNKNCYFAVLYLKENHYSIKKPKMPYLAEWQDGCEYHALCEGDDYWIHPGKLQMQVEYLDSHAKCILCFHNAIKDYDNSSNASTLFNNIQNSGNMTLKKIILRWVIPTASIVYRSYVKEKYPEWTSSIYSGDMTLAIISFYYGEVYCFNKVMSVYRINYKPDSFTSMFLKKEGFVQDQQIKLFTKYDEFTNFKFHKTLRLKIKMLRKAKKFEQRLAKSKLLAYCLQPDYVLFQWYVRHFL